MLSKTFLHLINVSIMASWLVLAIVIFRLLFKKAPKYITCALWALVAIRLIFPISIESPVSLIPSKETIPLEIEYSQAPAIDTGIDSLNTAFNPVIQQSFTPTGELTSINPIQLPIHIGAYLWQMVVVLMTLYALISYIRIHIKVRERIKQDKNIYICDRIPSPFILGIIRPKIYLPSHLDENDAAFVKAHEKAHIKRLDYIWKPLGYILLTIYWFNPLLWLGYILLCRDIEYACDEKVVREMSGEEKKGYSETLLNLSIHRPYVTACPLAFGESGVKGRIISVLNYKKPAFVVIAISIVLCIAMVVCFLTNPPENKSENAVGTYTYMETPSSISFLPYLELYENNEFRFVYDELMNFIISGEYELTYNELILHSNRGVYTFTRGNNSFIFNAEKSDENPSSVPDGAVFIRATQIEEATEISTEATIFLNALDVSDHHLKDYLSDFIDKIYEEYPDAKFLTADMDDNGIEETWLCIIGSTSGVNSHIVAAYENNVLKYLSRTIYDGLMHLTKTGDKLQLLCEDFHTKETNSIYDIVIENGNVQLK